MRKVPFFGSSIPGGGEGGEGGFDSTSLSLSTSSFFFSESIWCRDLPRLGVGGRGGRKCYCISYPTDLSRRNMKFLTVSRAGKGGNFSALALRATDAKIATGFSEIRRQTTHTRQK